jgi:hypothetical protein
MCHRDSTAQRPGQALEVADIFRAYGDGSVTKRGRVSDVHFGLATIHDLVDVTAGTKLGNDALSLSFSRRPRHDMESGKVHI